jgi:hypothetical protein
VGIQTCREIERQNQQDSQNSEVHADRGNPVKRAAALMRGRIIQHRFCKNFVQRLYWRTSEYDMRPFRRGGVYFADEQDVALHEITPAAKCSGPVHFRFRQHGQDVPGSLYFSFLSTT